MNSTEPAKYLMDKRCHENVAYLNSFTGTEVHEIATRCHF